MMRPFLLIFLLALHLLLSITQGIRIDTRGFKKSLSIHEQQQQHMMRNNNNIDHGRVDERKFVVCKQREKYAYPVPGKSRKLMISITPPTTKTNNGSNSEPKVNSGRRHPEQDEHVSSSTRSPSSDSGKRHPPEDKHASNINHDHIDGDHDHYNDITVEITEMDYSSAQRKPPIHN